MQVRDGLKFLFSLLLVVAFTQVSNSSVAGALSDETIQIDINYLGHARQVDFLSGRVPLVFGHQGYGSRPLTAHNNGLTDSSAISGVACAVYAADRQKGKDSQLLTINPRTKVANSIGQPQEDRDIEGLAIHPTTQTLYAISGQRSAHRGELYLVDHHNGTLDLIGNTGFAKLKGLAFHPGSATLWSWMRGTGLVEIDPATGASSVQLTEHRAIEDLAWSPDGTLLYAVQGTSLWVYDPGDNTFEKIANNLPANTQAVEMRPDGLLLGSKHDAHGIHLYAYDVATRQVVMESVLTSQFDDIEAIAWSAICGNPSPGGEATIIQSVSVDKQHVCAGESLLVTVTAEHPEAPQNTVDISINGVWGSSRYLQFTGEPGTRLIHITAATPEKYIDTWEEQVEVVACDASQIYPDLAIRPNPYRDLTVDFDILNADEFEAQNPTYLWEFGDEATEETVDSFVTHDYSDAVDRDQLYTVFQAQVTVKRDGQPDVSTQKTVTVWNMYAFNKKRGIIQPRIETAGQMDQVDDNYVGTYTLKNLENEGIQFTSRQLEYQFCDPERDPTLSTPESLLLNIDGAQEVAQQIAIPISSVSSDVCGVAVHLVGQTNNQVDAYASIYFDLQDNPVMRKPIDDPALLDLLNDIVARGLASDPYHITDEDLYYLKRAGEITFPPLPVTSSASSSDQQGSLVTSDGDVIGQQLDQSQIGELCTPGDPPPRPGVTCQATGEWTIAPPHIKNALRGDVILSAGCGVIGELLRQVSPPQRYSHSGIMTRNYYEVRHSTASTARYKDYGVGFTEPGSDGIRSDVIKYGWPGTITQSIDEAFNGEYVLDPEERRYEIEGFSADPVRCEDDLVITYPYVVKPPPGHDPSIRAHLHEVADAAESINGHYRFFSYTNGAISEDNRFNAPADAGWAENTAATVCSSFIWTALRKVGIEMEGPRVEPEDFRLGADPGFVDGLYFYTEVERRAAGEWLYDHFYDLAYEKAGWLGRLFTDAPDDVANQITNCFANDTCDKDSEAWRNPGVGSAVSPDNILFWDAPETGGVYGYDEPLVYRSGDYVQLSRWQPSEGVGTITGRVLLNGNPVENASVTILGIELFTDANGQFQDDLIPAGTYEIEASKMIGGLFYSVRQTVTISAGETTAVTLVLQPPPNIFRQVTIQGLMTIHDHETWIVGDDLEKYFDLFGSKNVNPFNRYESIDFKHCVGNEVRVELDVDIRLESDNTTVAVTGEARLYEDDGFWPFDPPSCNEGERKKTQTFSRVVLADTSSTVSIRLEDDGDRGDIDFTIDNLQQGLTTSSFIPVSGGRIEADGTANFNFPAGTFNEDAIVTYTTIEPFRMSRRAGIFYVISAADANSGDPMEIVPGQSYTVTIHYNNAEITAGANESDLALFYWDGTSWIAEPTSVTDPVHHEITARPTRLGIWAAPFDPNSVRVYLPVILR